MLVTLEMNLLTVNQKGQERLLSVVKTQEIFTIKDFNLLFLEYFDYLWIWLSSTFMIFLDNDLISAHIFLQLDFEVKHIVFLLSNICNIVELSWESIDLFVMKVKLVFFVI
jgi:hypothetical protein